jgi:homoserine kinase
VSVVLAHREARAFAPASVGNVAVGFDILGHALAGVGDTVIVRRASHHEIRITDIRGVVTELPREASRNTAARAIEAWREAVGGGFGIDLEIEKGIAFGSGMGGSAASASAAVVAANALLERPLEREALYPFALVGEAVSSGAAHGDNIAPQLLGGLVLAAHGKIVRVPVPAGLMCVLARPDQVLETRTARAVLKEPYALGDFVEQSANLSLLLAGCWRSDFEFIRAGLADVLVEPRRAPLIKGFAEAKAAALAAGALGASISGAGPSVFAWCEGEAIAQAVAVALTQSFTQTTGTPPQVLVSPVDAPGARVLSCVS